MQIKKEIYLWQIEDTEADLNEAKERIGKSMPDIAVGWMRLCPTLTERIYAFDQNGKEISHSTRGTSTSTKLPSGYNYKDAILTHNHPGKGLTNNIAGRIGRSFSSADIAIAVTHNAAEVRAITSSYTYSMKRPKNGWGISTPRQAVNVARKIKEKRNKYFNAYVAKPSSDYTHGRMSREQLSIVWDRADVVSTNKALREVAKELGWDYTRKRTS